MMREKFTSATIAKRSALAMAGLVLAATIDVASASISTGSAGDSARFGAQRLVRLAEAAVVTNSKNVKKPKVRGSGKTWLNPQPEPPMGPAKVDKGGTWLNPQPEPPRPVTGSKKLN
ncbi:hypothetical protein KMZ29_21605 [Bradyrhizobium sediminis]|uniref:DUF680 domain-containing protein n=1 Tax=Bradyrhizobium sediminis TaxID=2840469 RepID=A0A975NCG0_9BRAD|nr:hypothetical protein [Bradyrhizobium sediminis]QWG12280.1 hypothetical protein KMZ29_21605 [Bradyrhizobium sediminis]